LHEILGVRVISAHAKGLAVEHAAQRHDVTFKSGTHLGVDRPGFHP
jgi:hypothetical protein